MVKHATPMLDELAKGPWPSFVDDIKAEAERRKANPGKVEFQIPADVCDDLLGILELSYKDKETHWKHGGIVGVFGYGGGVIGRYCDVPQKFPGVAHFHTVRVAQPSGKYYTTEFLRGLMDIWELRGSGMLNMHGSTGDIVMLGTFTEQLEEIFFELTHNLNNDLGGSGSNLRTPAGCLGMSRCEYSCYDVMALEYAMVQEFQDELHRPAFPYKFKFKFDGCPNGCVAAMARSDFSVVGTWKDDIRIDQAAVKGYVGGEFKPNAGAHSGKDWGKFDIVGEVTSRCPTQCMSWDGSNLTIDNKNCVRCMHCINTMPRALKIGKDTGATILLGAKAPILDGQQMGSVIVPFVPVSDPFDEVKEYVDKIWEWWMEEGKNRERIGETMRRMSLQKVLDVIGVEAAPQHVLYPRENPYIFWKEEEVGGWDRPIDEYRKRHAR